MKMIRFLSLLLLSACSVTLHAQTSVEPVNKSFSVEAEDEQYVKTPAVALFRFYSLANGDTAYGPQHSSEQIVFKEFLHDKDGIEIRVDTLLWHIPMPRVPGDDSLHIKFLIRNDALVQHHKINVSIVLPDKRSCYYSIPGDDAFRSHFFFVILPPHTDSLRMQQWRDSTLALDARLNPLDRAIDISVYAGDGKKYDACTNYAMRCYKRLGKDTLFANWSYATGTEHMNLRYNTGWLFEIEYAGNTYHGQFLPDHSDYCRMEFYIDTTSADRSFAAMRYTAKGYEYYGYSHKPGDQVQRAFMCKDSETNKRQEITFGRRFLIPNLSRTAHFVQGVFSVAPFNRYAGLQWKRTQGEAGIFIVDDITALRYHYGTEAGREMISLDKSYTINFFMGPLRGGLGTSLTGGRDRFGWSVRPLLGLSNGGVDLYVSYDLYLVGGKKIDDLSRFNFTVAIGPFITRKHRPGRL